MGQYILCSLIFIYTIQRIYSYPEKHSVQTLSENTPSKDNNLELTLDLLNNDEKDVLGQLVQPV